MYPTSTLGILPRPSQLPPWRLASTVAALRRIPAPPHHSTTPSALSSHSASTPRQFTTQPKQLRVPELAKLRILDPPDIFEWPSKGKEPSSPCPDPEEKDRSPVANDPSKTEEGVERPKPQSGVNEEEHGKRSSSPTSRCAGSCAPYEGEVAIEARQASILSLMHYLVGITSRTFSRMIEGLKSWSRISSVFSISSPTKDLDSLTL